MDSPRKSATALLHRRRSSSRFSINAYGTQRIHTCVCINLWRKTVRHTAARVLDDDFASAATATKYFRTCLSGRVRSILCGFAITADTRCREQGGLPRFHSLRAVAFFLFANTQHHRPPYVYYCVRTVFRLCEPYVTIRADTVDIRFARASFLPRIIYYYDYYCCNILCMRTHARTG